MTPPDCWGIAIYVTWVPDPPEGRNSVEVQPLGSVASWTGVMRICGPDPPEGLTPQWDGPLGPMRLEIKKPFRSSFSKARPLEECAIKGALGPVIESRSMATP